MIDWKRLLEGINIEYLAKNHIEMNTSPCVHHIECMKIYKLLDERFVKQMIEENPFIFKHIPMELFVRPLENDDRKRCKFCCVCLNDGYCPHCGHDANFRWSDIEKQIEQR